MNDESLIYYEELALHVACKHFAPAEQAKPDPKDRQNVLWLVAQLEPLFMADLHNKSHRTSKCGHSHDGEIMLAGCLMNYKTKLK